jgi:outer membrane protein assembly factor BamE (lipoprotein component of BamABCDE complex)
MALRSHVFAPAFALALCVAVPASSGAAQSDAEAETAGLALDPSCATAPDAWKDAARWLRLRRGMSRFDVLRLLGDPGKVSAYDGFERWEYPGALGARVNFDDRGRVRGWIAP